MGDNDPTSQMVWGECVASMEQQVHPAGVTSRRLSVGLSNNKAATSYRSSAPLEDALSSGVKSVNSVSGYVER